VGVAANPCGKYRIDGFDQMGYAIRKDLHRVPKDMRFFLKVVAICEFFLMSGNYTPCAPHSLDLSFCAIGDR
jgi:hypothetical protein